MLIEGRFNMKTLKKLGGVVMGIGAFFVLTVAVAAAGSKTLGYQEYERITVNGLGETFYTQFTITAKSGTPTLKTQVGRKMFNLIWYDSGSTTTTISSTGYYSPISWNANGTWDTRATWTNITSGTSLTGTFNLY